MKTEYKYIHFLKVAQSPKTSVWVCLTNRTNDRIGRVKWYPGWRQYSFFPQNLTVFNKSCLGDIIHFIEQL